MLDIVIRVGSYVEWFLIPETYNQKQFDALVNLPGAASVTHIRLWRQWILGIGGKYSDPRTVHEFHMLDGRHVNIKVDGDRVYIFNDSVEKTLFYANGQWCEVPNFDHEKLPWIDWLMSEPGVTLSSRYDNFKEVTGALPYLRQDSETVVTKYVYQVITPQGFIPFNGEV